MDIKKVKIVKSYEAKDFEEEVNNLLKKGYKISSNLVVTPDKDYFVIMGKCCLNSAFRPESPVILLLQGFLFYNNIKILLPRAIKMFYCIDVINSMKASI